MFLKKIPNKLHSILFPGKATQIFVLKSLLREQDSNVVDLQEENLRLIKESEDKKKESLADLMRDNLKLTTLNFSNVEEDGAPRHFLDLEDKSKRTQYVNELYQISQFEVFHVMCQNHIDTQGNFSLRNSENWEQDLAGRFSINGISLIRNEVKRAYEEYMERSKPPEEFDEFETTEGITIKKEE